MPIKLTLLALSLALLPGLAALPAGAAEPVVVNSIDWCPFSCPGPAKPGIADSVAAAAMAAGGRPIQVVFADSWKRAVNAARAGKAAGLLLPAKGDTPDFLFPSRGVGYQQHCAFTPVESQWSYAGPASFKTVNLVGILTDIAPNDFAAGLTLLEKEGRLFRLDAPETGARMMKGGRIDAFIEERHVFRHITQSDPAFRVAGCGKGEPIYLAFPPKVRESKALLKAFEDGFRAIEADGRLAEILGRYGAKLTY